MTKLIFLFSILSWRIPGPSGLELLSFTGPGSLREGSQAWVELTCTFSYTDEDFSQLDIKWYHGREEEPFLIWIPSISSTQVRNERLQSTISVRNTSAIRDGENGHLVGHIVHFRQPSHIISGLYTCRVATFLQEFSLHHNMIVYDPGLGPYLQYHQINNQVNLSCMVENVFPEPVVHLHWTKDHFNNSLFYKNENLSSEMTTTTIRRGHLFSVKVHTIISISMETLSQYFTCHFLIPHTDVRRTEQTVFFPGTQLELKQRPSTLSSSVKCFISELPFALILCLGLGFHHHGSIFAGGLL